MRSKDLIKKRTKERASDSIPPPAAARDELINILAHNMKALPGDLISSKEAVEAMRGAGANVHSVAKLNDICRKYLGRKGYYVP